MQMPSLQRVLVVDDNEDAAEVLAIVLRDMGHEVQTACDGKTALAAAIVFKPTVAWLDLGMPGMNGIELAQALQQNLGQPCFLIALSGFAEARDREATTAAGFNVHLLKPVELSRIRQVMAEL